MTHPTLDTFQPKIRHPRRVLKVLAVAVLGTALSAQAGKISSVVSATGAPGSGGWNLGNVQVVLSGTQSTIGGAGSWFDPQNGAYHFATDSDFSYQGLVKDRIGTVMGIVLAKDWPIGEPSGIKIVNDDSGAKVDKPANCIMSPSYLKDHYLDSADPRQVICSSPFQTHKRYKVAMLPTTLNGTGSKSVDLVFNVETEAGGKLKFNFRWTAHLANPAVAETVEWVASITVNGQIVDGAEAVTLVEVKKGKNGG